jgi:hypothetical protein
MKPAAHGLDEDVGGFEVCRGCGMAGFPTFEAGERVSFLFGARSQSAEISARAGSPVPLVVRRPWRVAEPVALMTRRQLEQRGDRTGITVHRRMTMAERRGCDPRLR